MLNPQRIVKEIQPLLKMNTIRSKYIAHKLRVVAYARVSTNKKEQKESYEEQCKHYTEFIKQNPKWHFAGIYADEGETATQMRNRKEFLEMIADAKAGKFDLIIVKNISRFARSVVDCVATVKELREVGVAVYFEKENLMSTDPTAQLTLNIMASVAEEESRNISNNGKWRIRRRFENGEVLPGRAPYGYQVIDGTDYKIIPKEAAVVRQIFTAFLKGMSIGRIVKRLNEKQVPSKNGGVGRWTHSQIHYMLNNERYMGDAKLQKTYKLDVLSKRKKNLNNGEAKMYYVEGNHTGIITKETFLAVKAELAKRNPKDGMQGNGKYSSLYAFSRKLRCAKCGTLYRRNQQRSRGNIKYTWVCANKLDGKGCNALPLREHQIEEAFVTTLSKVIENQATFLSAMEKSVEIAIQASGDYDVNEINAELKNKQDRILELSQDKGKVDQREFNALLDEIDKLNNQLDLCEQAEMNVISVKQRLKEISELFAHANLHEFNTDIFKTVVEEAIITLGVPPTVPRKITFRFKCGIELTQEI